MSVTRLLLAASAVLLIAAPIMWMYADADMITPAHLLEIWSLFGGGERDAGVDGSKRPRAQLAIVPHVQKISYVPETSYRESHYWQAVTVQPTCPTC